MDDSQKTGADSAAPHPHSIYMLRTMQQQHMTLSAMADQKANMLLGVSSVVLALVVREGSMARFHPAMIILTVTVFLAALCCLLAVLPSIGRPPAPVQPVQPNMLFFGVFTEFDEEAFHRHMQGIMGSDEAIYRAMIRDVYQQGLVLKRKKYRFLGYAYRVFIVGLVLTFVALLIPGL
ncbi:Pycsar system effector family protein [Polymorphobacter sp.]|uniref:Pycsar system effector family protein n=1 Tax=Polymorphobacter sp. TaxID=1909290 RepID=UPI003F712E38